MEVLWLNRTEMADPVCGFLVRWGRFTAICYRTLPEYRALLDQPTETSAPVFRKIALGCLRSGHYSGCRHLHFEFSLTGISRSCTHQLVRHERFAPINQQSSRYVNLANADFVLPPAIAEVQEAAAAYEAALEQSRRAYGEVRRALEKTGLKGEPVNEAARMVLPQALMTGLNLAPTFEALVNMSRKRLCVRAEWEIREAIGRMTALVAEAIPELGRHFGPPCRFGECKEIRPCSR